MNHTTYIIIGGGLAADHAIRELIRLDPDAPITLLSAESTLPYERPALSKDLLTDPDTRIPDIMKETDPYSEQVSVFLGRKAVTLHPEKHEVLDSEGQTHTYKKCLLATGGHPKEFPFTSKFITYFRTLSDFKQLQKDIALGRRVAVVGAGHLGLELAAALSDTECEPFMIFPGKHLAASRFPEDLSRHLEELFQSRGVDLLPEQRVTGIVDAEDHAVIETDGQGRYIADRVIVGIGIEPNDELARDAGLEVEDGIKVNGRLQTSHPDIFAAGDNATVYREALEKYARVEHEMNAIEMGSAAGRSMAQNEVIHFDKLPLYYSDILGQGFEAVGELNTNLEIEEHWKGDFDQGVVAYHDQTAFRGFLFWNVFGKTDQAKKLLGNPPEPETLDFLKKLAS